jgi:integrase
MSVSDRWHKEPEPGDTPCRCGTAKRPLYPSADHRKGDRWQVRWRDDAGRQRKQNFARRADADARDAGVRASLTTGTYIDAAAGKVKFAAFADQWRQMQIHREATETIIERALRLHVNPVIGHLSIAAVRPSHIQQLVRQLSAELAPSTVTVTYGFVAAMFTAAVRDRLIGRTPCDGVRLPARSRRESWTPDPAMVRALAAGLAQRYRAIPETAAQSGLRPSELMGLEVECVDFLRRTVRVRQQLLATAAGNVPYLAPPKTPQSDRTVPVTRATIDMIAAHLAACPAREVQIEDRSRPGEPVRRAARLVFTTSRNKPITRATWGGIWAPAARKAGFPAGSGLHSCRHLYASALIRFGESVKTVQHLMGHSSPTVTLEVYAHLWPDSDDRARQAVESAWADVPSVCPAAEANR